jgi:hypothetical protein
MVSTAKTTTATTPNGRMMSQRRRAAALRREALGFVSRSVIPGILESFIPQTLGINAKKHQALSPPCFAVRLTAEGDSAAGDLVDSLTS